MAITKNCWSLTAKDCRDTGFRQEHEGEVVAAQESMPSNNMQPEMLTRQKQTSSSEGPTNEPSNSTEWMIRDDFE